MSTLLEILKLAIPAIAVIWCGYISRQIRQVHTIMNSRLTELLEVTKKDAHAEGVIEGKKLQ